MSCSLSRQRRIHYIWLGLVFMTFIGCGLLLYLSLTYKAKLNGGICHNVCTSKECISASNSLIRNMNQNVNPCRNFYSFACGNWISKFGKQDNCSVLNNMWITLKLAMKDVLEDSKGEPGSASSKMKIMYDSCMNEKSSEFKAVPTALQFLSILGMENWPKLRPDFEFSEPSLAEVLSVFEEYGEFAFVTIEEPSAEENEDNTNPLSFTILGSYAVLADDSQRSWLRNILFQILNYFQLDDNSITNMLDDFLNIDKELLKFLVESNDERCDSETDGDDIYLDCSEERADYMRILCSMLSHIVDGKASYTHYSKVGAFIPCRSAHFVTNVFTYIDNLSHRSLANYLALRFFFTHLEELSSYFRIIMQKNIQTETVEHLCQPEHNKWEFCIGWISHYMFHALGLEYIPRQLPAADLLEIREIVREFSEAAANITAKQLWINEVLRRILQHKVGSLINEIDSYVTNFQNQTFVDSLYGEFNPTRESFLQNILEYQRTVINTHMLDKILELPSPFVVNAYSPVGGVDLRFGILMPPVYLPGLPRLVNIATLGSTIGHEIGHAIVHFLNDQITNVQTKENFHRRTACFTRQYSRYKIAKTGRKVQGNKTLDENLADNIGMQIVQQVVKKYLNETESGNFSLPGLNYSSKQLLYISYMQMWCATRSKEREEEHFERDVHAPPNLRVIGMVQNSREFSEAFNCPIRSAMNPIQKCSVYD